MILCDEYGIMIWQDFMATVIGQCVAGIVAGTCNHKYNHDVSLSSKASTGYPSDRTHLCSRYSIYYYAVYRIDHDLFDEPHSD